MLRNLLMPVVLATSAVQWAAGADRTMDDTLATLRRTAPEAVPYTFGSIAQVTIVPDKRSVRLTCGENPEDVGEVLIGADANALFIYCVLSTGTVSGGGSPLGRYIGSFRQVGGSAAIGRWQVKEDKIDVAFQLTSDRGTIVQTYRDLKRSGRFSTSMQDWETLFGDTELICPRLTAQQRVEAFSRLWSTVQFNFANFDLVPDLRWDDVLPKYLPRVMRDQSNDEFVRLLQECVAQLKDGHTGIGAEWGTGSPSACPPLRVSRIEGKAVITQTAATKEITASGISVGDEITHVDGRGVQEVLENDIYPYICASTPQSRNLTAYPAILTGRPESKVSITISTPEGKARKVSLTRKAIGVRLLPADRHSVPVEYRDLGNGLAYVALNAFDSDRVVQMFKERFPQVRQAKGLLIDIRNNGGGNSAYGDDIISLLIEKPIPSSRWKTPQYRAAFRAWGRDEPWYEGGYKMIKPGTSDPFTGAVVVVIGPGTFSAAEDFVVPLHASGRATIVGQPSAGSTGEPLGFSFLDGKISGRVCTKRDQYPDGREFVGTGIVPDRQIEPTVKDVIARRDGVLDRAIEVLKEQVTRHEQREKPRD